MHALIVIDVQNDFCPGGALAVAQGDEIVQPINALMADFDAVVLTQDWHPAGHSSFASTHEGKAPFEMIEMPYGPQVLWPDHCIQASPGANFHMELETDRRARAIVRLITSMAGELGIHVTAEGVETNGQIDALSRAGCQTGQGYFYGKPMPLEDLAAAILNSFDASQPESNGSVREPIAS